MVNPGLQDQIAVITGGNSGIGATVAKVLAGQEVRVAVHYHPGAPDEGALHTVMGEQATMQLVEEIRQGGGDAMIIGKDLLEPDAAEVIIRGVEEGLGAVDLLINNAAHCEAPDTLEEANADVIDRHFAVNARAAVLFAGGHAM